MTIGPRGVHSFFREAGFADAERLPGHYGGGSDGLRMRLRLAPPDASG